MIFVIKVISIYISVCFLSRSDSLHESEWDICFPFRLVASLLVEVLVYATLADCELFAAHGASGLELLALRLVVCRTGVELFIVVGRRVDLPRAGKRMPHNRLFLQLSALLLIKGRHVVVGGQFVQESDDRL